MINLVSYLNATPEGRGSLVYLLITEPQLALADVVHACVSEYNVM